MKIGYQFPRRHHHSSCVLLSWFIVGGYAMPDGRG
ncbi:YoaK family small membrane protein [Serratia liquefaciens]|nr:YoaK family small membrane protein [Serratia liquefaciens]